MDSTDSLTRNPEEQPAGQEPEALEFTVMPKHQQNAEIPPPGLQVLLQTGGFNWRPWAIGAFAVLLVGSLGFFIYVKFFQKVAVPEGPAVPQIAIPQAPAPQEDRDHDGLSDKKEQQLGTNPQKADTDGDGLADGDEIQVYLSDPLLFDTDNDGFDDGREVARGYSPVSAAAEKAGALELEAWTKAIEEFGLHEPTSTTLKLKAVDIKAQSKTTYTNTVYGYSVELPEVLAFREAEEGRKVGLYVASATPPDFDIETDPITFALAVKVEGESLEDWINSQYRADVDYEVKEELELNVGEGAVRLRRMPAGGEACPADRTFLAQGNNLIILTLTCADLPEFAQLYEQIVQSFKFLGP